jgi:hypothetical protein
MSELQVEMDAQLERMPTRLRDLKDVNPVAAILFHLPLIVVTNSLRWIALAIDGYRRRLRARSGTESASDLAALMERERIRRDSSRESESKPKP